MVDIVFDGSVTAASGGSTIGYTSPIAETANTRLSVVGASSALCEVNLAAFKNSTTNGSTINLLSSKTDTVGGQGLMTNGSQLGSINWKASDGVGYIPAATISATISGGTGVNDMPTTLTFGTTANGASASTTRLTITDTGLATFANAVTTTGLLTASSGINLGQDTLNYYDEGTFTPVLRFGSGSTGITYAQQAGFYIRTGSTVWFKVVIVLTSKGSDTGAASFTGLPFTASNDNISGLNSFYPYLNLVTFTANPLAYILDNTSTLSLSRLVSAGTNTNLTDAAFVNTSRVIIVGTYDV